MDIQDPFILERRRRLLEEWTLGWRDMAAQWAGGRADALWVMYSANYLVRTGGVRWMIDPFRFKRRRPDAADVPMEALAPASFLVMTHNHGDHVDVELLSYLATLDHLKWILPAHMEAVREKINLPAQRVIVPQPGQPIVMGDGKIKITPFTGLHWQYPSGHWEQGEPSAGVDATGYLFEWDDKRLLLPGDTRTYDVSALPRFGPVDTLLGHVWLGRGGALLGHVWLGRGGALEDPPPCLEAFCRFMAALEPTRRILLTHLWEQSRDPANYWDERHAEKVRQRLLQLLPAGIDIQIPDFWKAIPL